MNWEYDQQEQARRREDALDSARIIAWGIVAAVAIATGKLLVEWIALRWFA